MKKPLVIFTTLVGVTASAVAFFVPPATGTPPVGPNQKVNGLAKGGLISQAQADALTRMQVAAAAHANESKSVMASQGQQKMPVAPGQLPAAGPAGGPQTGAGTPPPPPPPPAPKLPGWHLEGTVVGGGRVPSAIFDIEGWGQVVIHPGEKLNELTKVVAIKGSMVTLRTKDKKTLHVAPW